MTTVSMSKYRSGVNDRNIKRKVEASSIIKEINNSNIISNNGNAKFNMNSNTKHNNTNSNDNVDYNPSYNNDGGSL